MQAALKRNIISVEEYLAAEETSPVQLDSIGLRLLPLAVAYEGVPLPP